MPVLPKPKWELFAQSIAKGVPRIEAYVNAGHSAVSPSPSACRLLQRPQVAARIKELKLEIQRGLAVDVLPSPAERLEMARRDTVIPDVWITPNIAVRAYRLWCMDQVASVIKSQLFDHKGNVNLAAARELREYYKQAAIESGQWSENQSITVKAAVDEAEFKDVPLDRLRESKELMEQALGLIEGTAEEVVSPVDTQ